MAVTISIINNKGGVGKTTSTGIMAELLAYVGSKVLVIDLDQQSNLSMMLGAYQEDSEDVINGIEQSDDLNIADIFKYRFRDKEKVANCIYHTGIPNLDIIPSSKRHKNTQLNIQANETGNNNVILRKAINTIKDDYDFILIDNAPANDVLTVNSMFTSDLIIIPVRMEGFSYKGLKETLDTIVYIKEEHDIDSLEFGGAFITQAETQTIIYKSIHDNYLEELGVKYLTTPIRKDIKIAEVETNFNPILEYCPDTNAVFDYANLILELNILSDQKSEFLKNSISQPS